MKVEKFEDLRIWQDARILCKEVYKLTDVAPWKYDSRFVQQIHASSGSVMDNIAEGFERDGNKEFINFLYIAKGSCGEVRSQLYRANDVGFVDDIKFQELMASSSKLATQIANLIRTLRASDIKGPKYQKPETRET